jgi:excisionase family DNA binding protein
VPPGVCPRRRLGVGGILLGMAQPQADAPSRRSSCRVHPGCTRAEWPTPSKTQPTSAACRSTQLNEQFEPAASPPSAVGREVVVLETRTCATGSAPGGRISADSRPGDLLTTAEVARSPRCSEHSVRRTINAGDLQASKPMKRWLVRRSEVDAWIERHCLLTRSVQPPLGARKGLRRVGM